MLTNQKSSAFLALFLLFALTLANNESKPAGKFCPKEFLKRVGTLKTGASNFKLDRLINSKVPLHKKLLGREDDSTPEVRLIWKAVLSTLWLDDILIPLAPINLPTLNATAQKTHLRGVHKLAGIHDYEEIEEGKYEMTFEFDNVELRTIATLNPDTGSSVQARARLVVGNLYLRVMWLEIDEAPYPVIARVLLTSIPTFEPYIKLVTGNSFTQPSKQQQIQMDTFMDHMQNVYFKQAIGQTFSQQNLARISNTYKDLLTTVEGLQNSAQNSNGNTQMDEAPLRLDGLMWFLWTKTFYTCDKYNMGESFEVPFEHKVGLVITKGTMTITGGEVKGMDYYRRDYCFGPTCWVMQNPGGRWVFKYDQIYTSYDIRVKYLGLNYNGKIVITESGHTTIMDYDTCPFYGCPPDVYNRELLDAGDMIVDINGLPITLNFLQKNINEIATDLRDRMLDTFATTGMERIGEMIGTDCPVFYDD